jgi:hypothetical protein
MDDPTIAFNADDVCRWFLKADAKVAQQTLWKAQGIMAVREQQELQQPARRRRSDAGRKRDGSLFGGADGR